MGYFDNYNRRRLELTGVESAETLGHMQSYFQDSTNWTQGMYENANGARCLVAAANHVRVSPIDDAQQHLRLAIAEVAPGVARIEDFNDTHTYEEVAAVIERAKQLAVAAQRCALPAPVAEILPPQRQAPPALPVLFNPRPVRVRRRRSLAEWIMD